MKMWPRNICKFHFQFKIGWFFSYPEPMKAEEKEKKERVQAAFLSTTKVSHTFEIINFIFVK